LSEQNYKYRWAIIPVGEALLEQAQRRVALLLNPTQTFTVVTHTPALSLRAVEKLVKGSSAGYWEPNPTAVKSLPSVRQL
jgi:hypothetical protein